ncbi:MAG TPA: tetratricopeptide repeat protein [Candidatus Obscuribacterales bacterium]
MGELTQKPIFISGRHARAILCAGLIVLSLSRPIGAQQPPVNPPAAEVAGPQPATQAEPAAPVAGPQPQSVLQFQESPAPNTVPTAQAHVPVDACWEQLATGQQLVRQGHPRQALAAIEAFIAQQPLEPEGYFWQAVAFDNLNEPDQALKAYTKAIEQVLKAGMDSAELRMNTGNVLLKQGKTQAAIEQYKRAAAIDPALGIVQLNLGRALIQLGDSQGALKCFQRCTDLHFQPPQLAYYQAKALLLAGRKDDARAQVQFALSKLPGGDEAAKKIKREFAELLQTPTNAALQAR